MRQHIGRPSPALVISCLALFVALGGTGYAAATGSIDSREVKNSSLQGKDVKNSSLTGSDVKNNSLTGSDVDEGKLTKVPAATTADRAASAGSANSANTAGTAGTAGNGVKAYGTVNADGSVIAAKSSNITVARESAGVYCVRANGVSSASRTLVGTADFQTNGVSHIVQYDASNNACANSGGWLVRTREAGADARDIPFSVVIP